MKTFALIVVMLMPPNGRVDDCLARLFRRLDEIRIRVERGGWTEQQRLDATRRALMAFIECRGLQVPVTSPNPNAD